MLASRRSLASAALPLCLLACTELIEDTGRACVIPHDVVCDCSEGEPCGPQNAIWNSEIFTCEGLYAPADDLEVEVVLRNQAWAPSDDAECSVELVGDQIRVSASYRENTSRHTYDDEVRARCPVPSLDAGTWTLVYDEIEASFVAGEDAPQVMACAGAAPY